MEIVLFSLAVSFWKFIRRSLVEIVDALVTSSVEIVGTSGRSLVEIVDAQWRSSSVHYGDH